MKLSVTEQELLYLSGRDDAGSSIIGTLHVRFAGLSRPLSDLYARYLRSSLFVRKLPSSAGCQIVRTRWTIEVGLVEKFLILYQDSRSKHI